MQKTMSHQYSHRPLFYIAVRKEKKDMRSGYHKILYRRRGEEDRIDPSLLWYNYPLHVVVVVVVFL
jgi:hypothetical protein